MNNIEQAFPKDLYVTSPVNYKGFQSEIYSSEIVAFSQLRYYALSPENQPSDSWEATFSQDWESEMQGEVFGNLEKILFRVASEVQSLIDMQDAKAKFGTNPENLQLLKAIAMLPVAHYREARKIGADSRGLYGIAMLIHRFVSSFSNLVSGEISEQEFLENLAELKDFKLPH